ncbi:ERAP1-like C-terminal domain-containing protein, partial [Streptomyces hirsutus]
RCWRPPAAGGGGRRAAAGGAAGRGGGPPGGARRPGAAGRLRAAPAPGSEPQLAWARFFARSAVAPGDFQLLQELLSGTVTVEGLDVDQELRWVFLEPLAAHGFADEKALAEELARDDTASGKRHQVRCLAARPSAEVKARGWARVVESEELSNALVEATIAGFAQPSQRELLAPYAEKYFAVIERVWEERSIQIALHVVRGLFPELLDSPETLDATDAWLAAHEDAPPALRRLVLEARDDLARALRGQACDAATG